MSPERTVGHGTRKAMEKLLRVDGRNSMERRQTSFETYFFNMEASLRQKLLPATSTMVCFLRMTTFPKYD